MVIVETLHNGASVTVTVEAGRADLVFAAAVGRVKRGETTDARMQTEQQPARLLRQFPRR